MDSRKIIIIEPGKRSDKPWLRGVRTSVQDVLEYLAGGMTVVQVPADFPCVTREDLFSNFAVAAARGQKPFGVTA